MDLSLVTIEDLVKEIESRSTEFICAYLPNNFQVEKVAKFYYGQGSYFTACGLSNQLNNDVLNNWNGELKTLQRINQEGE